MIGMRAARAFVLVMLLACAPEPSAVPVLGDGRPCDTLADCRAGEICRAGRCVLGCRGDEECTAGTCRDGTCTTLADLGEACDEPDDCLAPWVCRDQLCRRPLGQACDDADECGSGFCADSVCCASACAALCERCGVDGTCGAELDGTGCDDGDACTAGDTCVGGACAGDAACLDFTDVSATAGLADQAALSAYGIAWTDYDADGWLDLWVSRQTTLVPRGARWRYLDDGSDQGTAWRERVFDDSGWGLGNAPLGYGDPGMNTTVSYGADPLNKLITTYFRTTFSATPATTTSLLLGMRRDDGGVVYLNGSEVFRTGMSGGTVTFATLASSNTTGANETLFFERWLTPGQLRDGSNTFAVEIHQQSVDSSDLVLDAFLVDTGALYHNNGDGTFSRGPLQLAGNRGGYWADPDNDGDLDLVTTSGDAVRLYLNDGSGGFTRQGLSGVDRHNIGTAVWLDVDRDGRVDLFLAAGESPFNELAHNDGGTPVAFSLVAGADVGLDTNGSNGETSTAADVDDDGDLDLWFNDDATGSLYVNNGDGTFSEGAAAAGLAIEMPEGIQPYYGVAFADYDNDGAVDLFLGHPAGVANRLYRNAGDGTFTLQAALATDLGDTRGVAWGDVDHDGDLDLLLGNDGASNTLYRNDGPAGFTDVTVAAGLADAGTPTKNVSFADFDNDGDLDLVVANEAAGDRVFVNQLDDDKYLKVVAVGRGAGYSSVDGIGARVELWNAANTVRLAVRERGGGEGFGSHGPPYVHFGLAAAWGGGTGRYTVRVRFASGAVVVVGDVVPTEASLVVGATTLAQTLRVDE